MFRDRVVAHYVHRGYTVEADKVITGESGSPHRCDLACHSDLGDLVVFFGDEEPFAGPEVASIKRAAADLGAGAVIAVPEATAAVKAAAREHRVILLEESTLDGPKEEEPLIETIDDGVLLQQAPRETAALHVPVPAEEVPAVNVQPADDAVVPPERVGAFDWLPEQAAAPVKKQVAPERIPIHWIWGPLLYLTATLILVFIGAWLFL